jgi:DNA polymerase delta subunit 1
LTTRKVKIQTIGGGMIIILLTSDYLTCNVDTDSVFLKFHDCSIDETISWSRKASAFFNAKFTGKIKLEYEKVWAPYIAIAKKKGIGYKFTKHSREKEIDLKGVPI